MASSEQDRRLVLALSGAAIEVEAQAFKDPTAQAIIAIAVPLMRDAAAALDRAVEVEDKEDVEAERAQLIAGQAGELPGNQRAQRQVGVDQRLKGLGIRLRASAEALQEAVDARERLGRDPGTPAFW